MTLKIGQTVRLAHNADAMVTLHTMGIPMNLAGKFATLTQHCDLGSSFVLLGGEHEWHLSQRFAWILQNMEC